MALDIFFIAWYALYYTVQGVLWFKMGALSVEALYLFSKLIQK